MSGSAPSKKNEYYRGSIFVKCLDFFYQNLAEYDT
jgi:hypothetical protein